MKRFDRCEDKEVVEKVMGESYRRVLGWLGYRFFIFVGFWRINF